MENGQLLTSIAELIKNNTTIVNKQDKTDNTLNTTDKTISGAINEINNNETTNATNLSSHISDKTNPHQTTLSNLKDNTITNPINKQLLGYDSATSKWINQDNVDEKVKINATSTSKYLGEWIDGISIQNVGGKVVAKSLDGLDITLREMNYLSGLDENIMTKFSNMVNGNGGIEVYKDGIFNTYADLLAFNFITLTSGKTYLMYVSADEVHNGNGTTYMVDATTSNPLNLPKYCGLSSATQRILSIDKVDLANETKGILAQSSMDMTDIVKTTTLANYETISDLQANYATITQVGLKANSSDVYTTTQTDNLLNNKLEASNIIAGSNITLTKSGNNITINSSGSGGGTSGSSIDDTNLSTTTVYSSSKTDSTYVKQVSGKSLIDDSKITKLDNITGTNTGDETSLTIKTKLGQANSTTDGYLSQSDWSTFNNKAETSAIPTKTSQITNDSNYVIPTNIKASGNITVTVSGTDVTINSTATGISTWNTFNL